MGEKYWVDITGKESWKKTKDPLFSFGSKPMDLGDAEKFLDLRKHQGFKGELRKF